ncbi:flagellar basal body P-ring formation chaperone FlgA [Ferrimonas balearica]|uniref:flagellar basal body P-ring formation chaperone FlgA n=1 Tax=Ferrimonas balearica TaxID=44012 RepID=UPI001C9918BF|nr:flagellar basal body P-ring formation chaperone FlgA [Ferrimonas balearica]MBY5992926.1 flagellar basal body P-ring formation protein FlgA [Ferrimonas balearica]
MRTFSRPWRAAGALLAALTAAPALANEFTPLETIRDTAAGYVEAHITVPEGARVTVEANALDNRLKYPHCQQPLLASAPGNNGFGRYVTVKVSCPDDQGWSLYVPVQTRTEFPVVVSTATLMADTLLEPQHLRVEYRDANSLRGNQLSDPEQLNGARLIRRVGAGQPIRSNNICLVCSGDLVTIYARTGGIEIKTNGEARGSGAIGDTIRVQNTRSDRIIEARVVGLGAVEVRM